MGIIYNGTNTAVPTSTSNNVFGAWTAITGVLEDPLYGFDLIMSGPDQNTNNLALNIGIGSSPASNLINIFYFNTASRKAFIPIKVPAGVALYAQSAAGATNTITPFAQIFGYSQGYRFLGSQLLAFGFSLSNTYLSSTIGASSTSQLTTSPILTPIKKLIVSYGNGTNFPLSIGIGPGSSVVETIIPNIYYAGAIYSGVLDYEFDVDIPAGMNIFVTNGSTTQAPSGGIYVLV